MATLNASPPAATRFATRPLSPQFGREVIGFRFSTEPDADVMREIQALADRHLVLLFRDQQVAEDAQVAFSKMLGTVIPPVEEAFTSKTNDKILRLGNVGMDGSKLAPDDPGTMFTYAPERWHSDGSYKPVPNYLSILHALEIPPEGGETWFCSMVAAYEALPEDTRGKIAGLEMEHPYPNSGKAVKGWEGRKIEVVRHPLVRQIPGGGRALFLSPFGGRIIGMDSDESDAFRARTLRFRRERRVHLQASLAAGRHARLEQSRPGPHRASMGPGKAPAPPSAHRTGGLARRRIAVDPLLGSDGISTLTHLRRSAQCDVMRGGTAHV